MSKENKPQPINEPVPPQTPDDEPELELPEHRIPTLNEILNRKRKDDQNQGGQ